MRQFTLWPYGCRPKPSLGKPQHLSPSLHIRHQKPNKEHPKEKRSFPILRPSQSQQKIQFIHLWVQHRSQWRVHQLDQNKTPPPSNRQKKQPIQLPRLQVHCKTRQTRHWKGGCVERVLHHQQLYLRNLINGVQDWRYFCKPYIERVSFGRLWLYWKRGHEVHCWVQCLA